MALSRRTGQRFQASIWPGFVDAMTGLLLVLMFVLTIFMVVQFVLRETITGQESELSQLTAEIAEIAEALGLEREKVVFLERELGTLTSTLNETNYEMNRQSVLISQLTLERDDALGALDGANSKIASFEEQVAGLIASQNRDRKVISAIESEKEMLISKQTALNLVLASARGEIDKAKEEARRKAAEREALESLIASLEAKQNASEQIIKGQNGDLKRLEEIITEKEAAQLISNAAAEDLRKKLKDAKAELTAMSLALEEQRKKAEDLLITLAAAEAVKSDFEEQIQEAVLALKAANLQIDNQTTEITELQEQTINSRSDFENAEIALAAAYARQINLEAKIKELEEQLSFETTTFEKNLNFAENSLSASQSERNALNERVIALETELIHAEKELENANGLTASLRLSIEELEISSLSENIVLSDKLANLKSAYSALAAKRDFLQVKLVEMGATLTEFRIDREELRNQLAEAILNLAKSVKVEETVKADAQKLQNAIELLKLQSEEDKSSIEQKLSSVLANLAKAESNSAILQGQLKAAILEKVAAEELSENRLDEARQKELLRNAALKKLKESKLELRRSNEDTLKLEKETAILNAQVAELRLQLGQLQALLDKSEESDRKNNVQIKNLGNRLNAALAKVATEERRRRKLEEKERKRLEKELEEKEVLASQALDLEKYKSEFFGRMKDVLSEREGVRIVGDRFVFSSEVLFAVGRADLSTKGREELLKVGQVLNEIMSDIPDNIKWVIRVDGHTDSSPIRNSRLFADNWELSQARALSVVRFMISELYIPPNRLAANGFGEFQPLSPDDTPAARTQNRRIELKLTEK